MSAPIRIALFASGTGSNALALLRAGRELAPAVRLSELICDRADAPILDKLTDFDVKSHLIERNDGKKEHEAAILRILRAARADWIFLAGYMRLLSPDFVQQWRRWHGGAQQVVNIHPSLLPAYPGLDAVQRAVAAGETRIGVTLHHVDEGMDTGAIIAQDTVPYHPGEGLDALMARVHALEHRLYTGFLRDVAAARVPTTPFQENP